VGFTRPVIHQENLISFIEIDPVTGEDARQFQFRINPDNLRVTKRKLEKYVLTKLGYERQTWGNDLFTYSYEGSSGVFRRDEVVIPSFRFDITTTAAWQKFKEFERFFEDQGEGSLRMRTWTEEFFEYIGSMPDFSFSVEANNPFRIRYNFTFIGIPLVYVPTEILVNE